METYLSLEQEELVNPIVLQRADPQITYENNLLYFTASHPKYDRIILRASKTFDGLQNAEEKVIWWATEEGNTCSLIWAPELHRINGSWIIYFAAAPNMRIDEAADTFNHRIFCLENKNNDPFSDNWIERGQVSTGWESFSLDATTFVHNGKQYLVWAQQDLAIEGHSNIYLAEMENPWVLKSKPVLLSKPEYDWERIRFVVNEGPAVLKKGDKIYITYSASGTGPEYAIGLLYANSGSDLLDSKSWNKVKAPVFTSDFETHQYGPGHNSFVSTADGLFIVYHARNYLDIKGDPLFDPNRHARIGRVAWDKTGLPNFGKPMPDNRWTPSDTTILSADGKPDIYEV